MISVSFQGKPFNITVIQVYAPPSNTEEAEVEQFYEDLQDLLELIPKKDILFIRGLECKSRKNHSFDYMDLCWQSNVSAFLYHFTFNQFLYFKLVACEQLILVLNFFIQV